MGLKNGIHRFLPLTASLLHEGQEVSSFPIQGVVELAVFLGYMTML